MKKIYDCKRQTNTTFDKLEKGDCFCCDGSFFIVVDGITFNAVCFNDNRLYIFCKNDRVIAIDGKIQFCSNKSWH